MVAGNVYLSGDWQSGPHPSGFAKKGTKAVPYPDQPFALNTMQKGEKEQAKQEKQDEKAKAYFQALAMSFNKKFQEKGGGVNG